MSVLSPLLVGVAGVALVLLITFFVFFREEGNEGGSNGGNNGTISLCSVFPCGDYGMKQKPTSGLEGDTKHECCDYVQEESEPTENKDAERESSDEGSSTVMIVVLSLVILVACLFLGGVIWVRRLTPSGWGSVSQAEIDSLEKKRGIDDSFVDIGDHREYSPFTKLQRIRSAAWRKRINDKREETIRSANLTPNQPYDTDRPDSRDSPGLPLTGLPNSVEPVHPNLRLPDDSNKYNNFNGTLAELSALSSRAPSSAASFGAE